MLNLRKPLKVKKVKRVTIKRAFSNFFYHLIKKTSVKQPARESAQSVDGLFDELNEEKTNMTLSFFFKINIRFNYLYFLKTASDCISTIFIEYSLQNLYPTMV